MCASYYYSNNEKVALQTIDTLVAVKTGNERNTIRDHLRRVDGEVAHIQEYGISLFKSDLYKTEITTRSISVRSETILPVYKTADPEPSDQIMISTEQFFVKFKSGILEDEIAAINEQHSVRIVETISQANRLYKMQVDLSVNKNGTVETANKYFESGKVEYAQPNFLEKRVSRRVPTNPSERRENRTEQLLSKQWHLNNANIIQAWDITKGDPSINIAVIDDGVDIGHPEFSGKIKKQYNTSTKEENAEPLHSNDNHGTAVAGVALAKGLRAYGVAPECGLIAVRIPLDKDNFIGSGDEAASIFWCIDNGADVINCSWGPPDNSGVSRLPDIVRDAINTAVTKGRGGKGIVICWAAGNGDESVSKDGYASSTNVIAVAACNDAGKRSEYSDFGKEIWLSAPSSDGLEQQEIITTDRQDVLGYNPSLNDPIKDFNYTSHFGGTSAAAPLVAGVVGLMLSVQPNLTWLDVKNILATTADKIGDVNTYIDSNSNLGSHSQFYGYGRINAKRALEAAKNWTA